MRNLAQTGEDFVVAVARRKMAEWGGVWRSVKKIDKDRNGYVTIEELDEIFREWFPLEMEGKTLQRWFRQWASVQNRNLINYREIKEQVNRSLLKTTEEDSA